MQLLQHCLFVYDISGQLVAEYTTSNATGGGTSYVTSDTLGTPRIITGTNLNDSSGGVKARHDYLPFGEEITGTLGGRNDVPQYAATDGVKQKFTGYERDNETGLDYAQSRYYSAIQGRFTSPDDFLNDTHVAEPQSWNLYAYVGNNPLRHVDPDGRIKRDENGNVIFEKTDSGTATFADKRDILDAKGNPTGKTVTISWQADFGKVYAGDGTEIKASRATGEITVTIKDADGKTVQTGGKELAGQLYGEDGSQYSNVADCHGVTFASGQVWINNDQVGRLMKGDGYDIKNPTSTPKPGDVGIYSNDGSLGKDSVLHSVSVNSLDPRTGAVTSVTSKGGITPKVNTTPGPGAGTAWPNPSAKLHYYTKKATR